MLRVCMMVLVVVVETEEEKNVNFGKTFYKRVLLLIEWKYSGFLIISFEKNYFLDLRF